MFSQFRILRVLFPAFFFLFLGFTVGCGVNDEVGSSQEEADAGESGSGAGSTGNGEAGDNGQDLSCEQATHMSIKGGEGTGVPGDAGASRWGIRTSSHSMRIRRSWSTLSDIEKQRVADAFLKLKQTAVDSGSPGAERADYESLCGESGYARNLFDYYVELHTAAFTMMGTPDMGHQQMPHMGPQFLPWHRYMLLRIEADMGEVLGDPDFALPYWDWEDCQADTEDGANPCPELFDKRFLGSAGSCDEENDTVTGYLMDQGFEKNIWTEANLETVFNTQSVRCSSESLRRRAACEAPKPATAADIAAVFGREVYDAEPYDSCNTDESVSFRQYLEGYKRSDTEVICWIGGCENHGRGHLYIGGDMGLGGAPTNDPLFFLHHANVDRVWAMWQDSKRETSESAASYGNPAYPTDWSGPIFNFPEVRADEMFDFRALGFTYDSLK